MSDTATSRLNSALEGRYVFEGPLGEGGMATVYLADDVRTRPDFAVTGRRRIAGGIGFYTDFDVAPDGRILALHRGRGTSLNAHTMLLVTDWRRGLAGGS